MQSHGHHGTRVPVDGVLFFVSQMRAPVLHLRDLRLGVVLACSSQGLDVDPGSSEGAGSSPDSTTFHIADCPTRSGSEAMSRACVFDSKGKTYRIDDNLDVLPLAPPYGTQIHFKEGYAPLPSDVSSQRPDASVRVYAAPYDVSNSTQCCAETSEENRIAAQTELSASGVLTITVTQALLSGYQIAIILKFSALYRGRVSPVCDLPSAKFCGYYDKTGFASRFYVGGLPGSSPSVAASQPTAGACLLSYNDALVNEGADPCCVSPQTACREAPFRPRRAHMPLLARPASFWGRFTKGWGTVIDLNRPASRFNERRQGGDEALAANAVGQKVPERHAELAAGLLEAGCAWISRR